MKECKEKVQGSSAQTGKVQQDKEIENIMKIKRSKREACSRSRNPTYMDILNSSEPRD